MTHATVEIGTLITRNPAIKGGRPCLAGTGMTVHTLAAHVHQGLSVEDICAEYPDLDRSLILAGLAHYFANKEAIDADLDADLKSGETLAREDWKIKGRAKVTAR